MFRFIWIVLAWGLSILQRSSPTIKTIPTVPSSSSSTSCWDGRYWDGFSHWPGRFQTGNRLARIESKQDGLEGHFKKVLDGQRKMLEILERLDDKPTYTTGRSE